MRYFSTDALVLSATDRGEHDKLLTLLAPGYGRFFAILKGAHSIHKREMAATEPFTYSNIEFYEKNGFKWVKSAAALETFPGIRYDMDKLFLAAYVAEVAAELSDEREGGEDILPLVLNTLHMLSTQKEDNARIKAVFELRAAAVSGFLPEPDVCARCGNAAGEEIYLDVMNGSLLCADCLEKAALRPLPEVNDLGERSVLCPLTAAAAAAISFVVNAEPKRIFSFRLKDEISGDLFCRAAEAYLLHHLERGFPTLENYKRLQTVRPKIGVNGVPTATEET